MTILLLTAGIGRYDHESQNNISANSSHVFCPVNEDIASLLFWVHHQFCMILFVIWTGASHDITNFSIKNTYTGTHMVKIGNGADLSIHDMFLKSIKTSGQRFFFRETLKVDYMSSLLLIIHL